MRPVQPTPQRGVVGRAHSMGVFDLMRWPPSAEAAPWVEHYWCVRWDLRGRPPSRHTVITFPAMHLTHEWGDDATRHGHPLPNVLVHGVVERVFTTTLTGSGAVVGARFRPGGFAARFACDASDYTGRVVPASATAVDESCSTPTAFPRQLDRMVAHLDAVIGAAHPTDPTYAALTDLLDRMGDDATLHRVDQVLALSPWSARTTQRVFRRYVGVPIKWVLCRQRLQHAALAIEERPDRDQDQDLAGVAVRWGWYDQAHFTNDFRAMLGCTPGEYAHRHG